MLMQTSPSGKSFMLSIDLNDCPWAREMKPHISILGWHMNQNGAYELLYRKTVAVQTFITTENERFVHVIPRMNASQEDIDQVFKYVSDYVESLNRPRSCEIDPATGKPPVENHDDWV